MIIFTIVYPKNDRLVVNVSEAIYRRFGVRPDLSSRVAVQKCYGSGFDLVRNRNSNVPLTTELIGVWGITTEDVFQNYILGRPKSQLRIEGRLDFSKCRVSVLGKAYGRDISRVFGDVFPPDGNGTRIATTRSYRNLALNYFERLGANQVEVITDWDGELEFLVAKGLADFIVDSVETGKSRDANALTEYDKIMDSRAIWILDSEKLFQRFGVDQYEIPNC